MIEAVVIGVLTQVVWFGVQELVKLLVGEGVSVPAVA